MKRVTRSKSFDGHLSDWMAKKQEMGVPESKLSFPFLVGAPKLKAMACRVCESVIYPEEEVRSCSMKNCDVSYHSRCASDRFGELREHIKCPQHECFHCKKKTALWRCSRCDLASHVKCAAYPEKVIRSNGETICWRHSVDSPPLKRAVPASSIEEVFGRLPVPYVEKEFKIDPKWRDTIAGSLEPVQTSDSISTIEELFCHARIPNVEEEFEIDPTWKGTMTGNLEPPSYVHIKNNIYRIKQKSCNVEVSIGDCKCGGLCDEDCICSSSATSCTSDCKCSQSCTNRQFPEQKKVKVARIRGCGWGVEASEFIDKYDYIIEYAGEVIDSALREKRLLYMTRQGMTKFYVVQVRKNFHIDATFKGNESRLINHSCDPNCMMEQWEINGETRLGLFALKSIEPGEELTFDYGDMYPLYMYVKVECHCGTSNCRGYVGAKKVQCG